MELAFAIVVTVAVIGLLLLLGGLILDDVMSLSIGESVAMIGLTLMAVACGGAMIGLLVAAWSAVLS